MKALAIEANAIEIAFLQVANWLPESQMANKEIATMPQAYVW